MDYVKTDNELRAEIQELREKLINASSLGEAVQIENRIDTLKAVLQLNAARARIQEDILSRRLHRENFTPPQDKHDRITRLVFFALSAVVSVTIGLYAWKLWG